jgi:hypothetical protein
MLIHGSEEQSRINFGTIAIILLLAEN